MWNIIIVQVGNLLIENKKPIVILEGLKARRGLDLGNAINRSVHTPETRNVGISF